jgi:hypothetical protein
METELSNLKLIVKTLSLSVKKMKGLKTPVALRESVDTYRHKPENRIRELKQKKDKYDNMKIFKLLPFYLSDY